MDERLRLLIRDFHVAVAIVLRALEHAGVPRPKSADDWAGYRLESTQLAGGFVIRKHGYGCEANSAGLHVDFDFGANGETDGFDVYRLWDFAEGKGYDYGFDSEDHLVAVFKEAISAGEILHDGYINHYLARQ